MRKFILLLPIILVFLGLFYFLNLRQKIASLALSSTMRQPNITINLVGDISFSRTIAEKINQYGVDYPFESTRDVLKNANLTVGNLESPFTSGQPDTNEGSMVFGAELKAVDALKNAGFDAINLANNHFANQGQEGMTLTFNTLTSNNIGYFGAGRNFNEAHKAFITEVNLTTVAFLGYTDTDVLPPNSVATEDKPGVATMDIEQLKIDIGEAKKQADLVLVSMHSGHEYTPNPNNHQKEFAHAAINAGADLVFGHHPHVVQGVENYNRKTIIYSLGNFVFDQPWSTETQQGIIAKLDFSGKILNKTELIPVHIANYCQPQIIADELEKNTILDRVKQSSDKLK